MKKILGILAVVVLALTGCSSSNDKLVVWAMGEEGNKLPQLTEKYTKETGQEIEVVAIPWDQAREKLLTAVASQEGPDLIQLGTSWIPEFADAGALADLSSYANDSEALNGDNYFAAGKEMMKYNDKLVSVPWYVDTRVLFYREDLLEKAGFKNAPKNWNELLSVAEKLSGDKTYGVDFDVKDQFLFVTYAWQNGWTALKDGKVYFTDEKFVETKNTYDIYEKFFKADQSELSKLKENNSEKKVFDFIINNKINDNLRSRCQVNKGGCVRKSINNLIFFNF